MEEKIYGKPVRLKNSTIDLLDQKLSLANDKKMGKKIKPSDLIQLALKLVTEKHIKRLQESSLTNEDRKEFLFQQYKKSNPQATSDDFIGFMMSNDFPKFLKQNGNFNSILSI